MSDVPLAPQNPEAIFSCGDLAVRYAVNADGRVEFLLLPAKRVADRVTPREFLSGVEIDNLPMQWRKQAASALDSLVQVRLRSDGGPSAFAAGHTMRNTPSTLSLKLDRQEVSRSKDGLTVMTYLTSPMGFACAHRMVWKANLPGVSVDTTFTNTSDKALTVEMLSSFSLGGITPYAVDDAPNRLVVHRFRSCWSAEGRHEALPIEDLHLERSWIGYGVFSERFGQVGSQPVRKWFPFLAIEDKEAGILWGAHLAWAGSWQMEIYRRDDHVAISGGLADREFGHWWKSFEPGESLTTPTAYLSAVEGDIEDLCHSLTAMQVPAAEALPEREKALPIIFNEWCTTWGNPTHESVVAVAKRLQGTPTGYLVIDDGWAERPGDGIQQNGDWRVNMKAFPGGLGETVKAVREAGLVPGIWFEFEVCTPGSKAYEMTDLHLHRDGVPLLIGPRHFWDFRNPKAIEYLTDRVIRLLKDNGFGYLKVDYNDTIGLGCDGAESLGEGLRQHIVAVQQFFRKIRAEIPDIVIENCSSGGHRLEPSMMGITGMGSFSDAHETQEIPIVAANLHRLILPRQNQVWAVLRNTDTQQRLTYSLAATFLGRMCLSGDLATLSQEQWRTMVDAQETYVKVTHIIRNGRSRRFGQLGKSFRHPEGWQALRRATLGEREAMVVLHTFDKPPSKPMVVPLPKRRRWALAGGFGAPAGLEITPKGLIVPPQPAFTGLVVHLKAE